MKNIYKKLILSILLDAIGFIPLLPFDLLWAPVSSYIMTKMYKGKVGKIAAIVSFLEEILPLDIVPTFTIMWFYTYVIEKQKDPKELDAI